MLLDRRIYLYFIIATANLGTSKCLALVYPSLIHDWIGSPSLAHLITAPPYMVACISCIVGGLSSSRRNEHGYHISFFLLIAILGFILMILFTEIDPLAVYIGSCVACCGLYPAFPLSLAWLTKNTSGPSKRALAVCLFTASGQIQSALSYQVKIIKGYTI